MKKFIEAKLTFEGAELKTRYPNGKPRISNTILISCFPFREAFKIEI